MMPTRMNQNTTQRYRKRIRDSAYAAMLATSTVPAAVASEVMKLEAYQFQMSPWAKIVRYDASVGLSIHQVVLVVSALGLSEVSIAHAIGTSQIRANAMSTPTQVPLNNRTRRSMAAWVTSGRAPSRARVSVASVVMSEPLFLAAGEEHPHGGHGEHEDEEQRRHRGGVAGAEVGEAHVVHVFEGGAGGEVGPAAGHDVGLVEDLQRRDDLQDDHQ